MAKIYKSADMLIGNTPLLELCNIKKNLELKANILAKLEFLNPGGSVKDRVAKTMLDEYEKEGLLTSDTVIIEPTSGNTGIGLCAVCASRGYKVILTMPETMSIERRKLLSAYGAEIVLTEGALGMDGAVKKAVELSKKYPNSFIPSQFENSANPQAHYNTTGPEIFEDTDGKIDILVACVGTGGTLSGTGRYLKEKNSDVKVIAVEPYDSPLLTDGKAGPHKIQGIGANFVPKNLDKSIYDEVVTIKTEDAYGACRTLAKKSGILVGISSGAAAHIASKLAKMPENKGKTI